MTPTRRKRLFLVLGIIAGVAIAATLALQAFRQNVMYFFDPSQVVAGEVKTGERFRLGGMVEKGSMRREAGSLTINFIVTDMHSKVPVTYSGVLPDLFKEGGGVVTHGRLDASGTFVADEVLAKHDENYMPPEVSRALKKGESRAGT
jgi:cytochrome c-type biogenesis protein CcmE